MSKAMANFFKIQSIHKYLNKEAYQTLVLGLCVSTSSVSNVTIILHLSASF